VRLDPPADAGDPGAVAFVCAATAVIVDVQVQPITMAADGDGGVSGVAW